MEITYFTDILFDLINESNALPIKDIESNDKTHSFRSLWRTAAFSLWKADRSYPGSRPSIVKILIEQREGTQKLLQIAAGVASRIMDREACGGEGTATGKACNYHPMLIAG